MSKKLWFGISISIIILLLAIFKIIPYIMWQNASSQKYVEMTERIEKDTLDENIGKIYIDLKSNYPKSYGIKNADNSILFYSEHVFTLFKNLIENTDPNSTEDAKKINSYLQMYFPETEASKKSNELMKIADELKKTAIEKDQLNKKEKSDQEKINIKKNKRNMEENKKMILAKIGNNEKDVNYWLSYFTDDEFQSIKDNWISIGDREEVIKFLKGYYSLEIYVMENLRISHYYGDENARYKYITAKYGKIDYFNY